MRIGELAERSGPTAKTLRFYEQAGVLPEPGRQKSGYRDYDEAAVARLEFIRAGQAAGLTLREIRQVIAVREREGARSWTPPSAAPPPSATSSPGDRRRCRPRSGHVALPNPRQIPL